VSRICADLDQEVSAFRDRSLAGQRFPYVFVDPTYCKARVNRRVVSQAVVVATGVCGDGRREVLGFAVVTARMGRSGPRSCGRSRLVGWPGCSWSSPTPTWACARPSKP
jgi:transposase-like protein